MEAGEEQRMILSGLREERCKVKTEEEEECGAREGGTGGSLGLK